MEPLKVELGELRLILDTKTDLKNYNVFKVAVLGPKGGINFIEALPMDDTRITSNFKPEECGLFSFWAYLYNTVNGETGIGQLVTIKIE